MFLLEQRQAGQTLIPLAHCYRRLHSSVFVPAKDFFIPGQPTTRTACLFRAHIWISMIRDRSTNRQLAKGVIDFTSGTVERKQTTLPEPAGSELWRRLHAKDSTCYHSLWLLVKSLEIKPHAFLWALLLRAGGSVLRVVCLRLIKNAEGSLLGSDASRLGRNPRSIALLIGVERLLSNALFKLTIG